jgi:hypothetical protein
MYMDIAAMWRVDWIWFFTQTYPERFQIPSCQIKNCNIFGNSLWDQTESHCCNFRRHWSCVWEEYLMVIWAQVTATSTKVLMTFDVLYIWTLIGSGHKQSQICMLFTLLVSWRGAQCVSTKSANTATNIHGDKEHAHKLQSTFCT